jgi:hypothetical protein
VKFGCSTAGEIRGITVADDSVVVTAVEFASTTLRSARVAIGDSQGSFSGGLELASAIPSSGLRHVLVLSDGLGINGSELARGLREGLPSDVVVTGGLSADGTDFEKTVVVWEGSAESGFAAILGLYGDGLEIGFGSLGGWDSFGPERRITRSSGNVLYELDDKSALSLYKSYLGEFASGLPSTGLLFPLCLRTSDSDEEVVRTILGVDETDQSMTFAGDMPEGSYARLMKANFDRLVEGAVGAATSAKLSAPETQVELAILVSCVGRRLVLRQRAEEEIEGVRHVLGDQAVLSGFYSYGEISPFANGAGCELHNQTMTITTFAESAHP